MTTYTSTDLRVIAIDPARLDAIRGRGLDEHGNRLVPLTASGSGEPLRCCLRYADRGEAIMLISYAHLPGPSVWREVGPVYVHAERCAGYDSASGFPQDFARGPFLLRTYDRRGSLDYAHLTLVPDGADVEQAVRALLAEPGVGSVHVRAVLSQCFLFEAAPA